MMKLSFLRVETASRMTLSRYRVRARALQRQYVDQAWISMATDVNPSRETLRTGTLKLGEGGNSVCVHT